MDLPSAESTSRGLQPTSRGLQPARCCLAVLVCCLMLGGAAVVRAQSLDPPAPVPDTQPASAPQVDLEQEEEEEDSQDGSGNNLRRTPHDVHALLIDETADVFRRGETGEVTVTSSPAGVSIRKAIREQTDGKYRLATHTSRVIRAAFPFNDLVPSWNVDVPEGTGFVVQIRMGRQAGDFWTPFYYLGRWGQVPRDAVKKVIRDEFGTIDIDYFRSDQVFDRIQYRLLLATTDPEQTPTLRRFGLAYSNTMNDESLAREHRSKVRPAPQARWARRLPVPFRSQRDEDPKIAGSVCSPTSTAMVMEYRGVNQPTAHMAEVIWDAEYRMFGNWARAVQGAYLAGVPGYLRRFGNWDEVHKEIAAGQPVIASIRVRELNGLRGAPYRRSNGHLLVIVGFDAEGNVLVNDPAARTADSGMATYFREDMDKAWLDHGGVGYVLTEPPPARRGQ